MLNVTKWPDIVQVAEINPLKDSNTCKPVVLLVPVIYPNVLHCCFVLNSVQFLSSFDQFNNFVMKVSSHEVLLLFLTSICLK